MIKSLSFVWALVAAWSLAAADTDSFQNEAGKVRATSLVLSAPTISRAAEIGPDGSITNSAVTATELGHVSGVTSAIQTQLDAKQASDSDLTSIAGGVTGIVKGAGNGAGYSAAASGTDYAPATSGSSILKGNGSGGFSSAAAGTDYAPVTSGTSILKGNGSGGFSSAAAGTDYAPVTSGTSILKGNGSGGFSSATAGTDYAAGVANPTGTIGLSAVNGSANSAIRSDGAPALSQAIVPTWTGLHIWLGNPLTVTNTAIDQSGLLINSFAGNTNHQVVVNAGGTNQFKLIGEGAGNMAQRNGLIPQSYYVYKTYTDASNYERGFMRWNGNILEIGMEKAGSGANRTVKFICNGGSVPISFSTGDVTVESAIGFSFGNGQVYGPSSGVIRLSNGTGSNLDRVQWGGTTASFPALKRSTTQLQVKLADDSAFTSLGTGIVEFNQVASGGTPASDTARIYAKDSGGTAEIYAMDEAGNESLQTPHPEDAPSAMEDRQDGLQDEFGKNINYYVGKVEWINQTRMARFVQRLLNNTNFLTSIGETNLASLPVPQRRIYQVETFAQYNSRTGATNLTQLDWATVQSTKQTEYDSARAIELTLRNTPVVVLLTNAISGAVTYQTNAVNTNVLVRPARDIRKPKPAWMP